MKKCPGRVSAISLFVLAAVVFSTLAITPVQAKGAGKKSPPKSVGWILDQTSEEAGRGELVITKDGVRIKLKNLTAVLTAPKFDAIIFDTTTKKIVELSYKQWSEKYKDPRPENISPTGRTTQIAGLKANCYLVPSRKVMKEVWFTTDIPLSEDMCSFISTTMHLPGGHGLPLRLEVKRGGNNHYRVFDTLKLVKSENVDAKTFQKPVGYKKVDSEYQLFVKDTTIKDIGGFLQ